MVIRVNVNLQMMVLHSHPLRACPLVIRQKTHCINFWLTSNNHLIAKFLISNFNNHNNVEDLQAKLLPI